MSNGIMCKGIFLTVKDIMNLNGTDSYKTAQREHSRLRDAMGMNTEKPKKGRLKFTKRRITIREYCKYMQIDFMEIWEYLRGKPDENNDRSMK